jgi:hypothetical protein
MARNVRKTTMATEPGVLTRRAEALQPSPRQVPFAHRRLLCACSARSRRPRQRNLPCLLKRFASACRLQLLLHGSAPRRIVDSPSGCSLSALASCCFICTVTVAIALRALHGSCPSRVCARLIPHCALIADIQDIKWFAYHRLVTGDSVAEQPTGDYCFVCGTALEVWPLSPKEELVQRFHQSSAFRKEFHAVRAGVDQAMVSAWRSQRVSGMRSCGLKVTMKVALVELSAFNVHFETPATAFKDLKVIQLMGPENLLIEGVLMSIAELPPNLPHFEVELFSYVQRGLEDILLKESDLKRAGHAQDRFAYACQAMVKERALSLKGTGPFKLPSYSAVANEKATIQREREGSSSAGDLQLSGNAEMDAQRVETVSGSSLLDCDGDEAAQKKKAKGAAKAKPSAAARMASPGSKQTPQPQRGSAKKPSVLQPSVCGARSSMSVSSRASGGAGHSVPQQPAHGAGSVLLSMDGAGAASDAGGPSSSRADMFNIQEVLQGWQCGRELKKAPPQQLNCRTKLSLDSDHFCVAGPKSARPVVLAHARISSAPGSCGIVSGSVGRDSANTVQDLVWLVADPGCPTSPKAKCPKVL